MEGYDVYTEFSAPVGVEFESALADEYYLACGWWGHAYCVFLSRYRTYVVLLRMDYEAQSGGRATSGLTDGEIEILLAAADEKMQAELNP
jgi:hypothetical protein